MKREQILATLQALKPGIETRFKVKTLALFGSVVRQE